MFRCCVRFQKEWFRECSTFGMLNPDWKSIYLATSEDEIRKSWKTLGERSFRRMLWVDPLLPWWVEISSSVKLEDWKSLRIRCKWWFCWLTKIPAQVWLLSWKTRRVSISGLHVHLRHLHGQSCFNCSLWATETKVSSFSSYSTGKSIAAIMIISNFLWPV